MTFKQYYRHYLSLHKNPKTRLLHFVGQIFTILFVIYSLNYSYWLLLLAPLVVYPFAWSGHYFFEKNKPAALKNPLYAKMSDWVMFKDILIKRLSIW
tara:strand:+ start:132 stop:422 length:291 start_codon:yes stop_codon:yes gene_type:complete